MSASKVHSIIFDIIFAFNFVYKSCSDYSRFNNNLVNSSKTYWTALKMKRNFIHMIVSSFDRSHLPRKPSNFWRSSGVFNVFAEFSNEINELWLNDDDYNDDDDDVGNFRHGFSFNALQFDGDDDVDAEMRRGAWREVNCCQLSITKLDRHG